MTERLGPEFAIGDVDLDGDDELIAFVFAPPDSVKSVVIKDYWSSEQAWKDVKQQNFVPAGTFQTMAIADVTGDRFPDFFVAWQAADETWWVDGYANGLGKTPEGRCLRLGPFLQGCVKKEYPKVGHATVHGCFDLDGDGDLEILVFSYPFDLGPQPRRLSAYDAVTGQVLWSHDMAPAIANVVYLEGQRGEEGKLIVGTSTPNNKYQVDGTTDSTSYVFCLSSSGKLRWRKPMGGDDSVAFVTLFDLDANGEEDVIVTRFRAKSEAKGVPNVLWLDPITGDSLGSATVSTSLREGWATGARGRGRASIVCSGIDGKLYGLDDKLAPLWVAGDDVPTFWSVYGIDDLDGDGNAEILVERGAGISVVDLRGHVLADAPAIPHVAAAGIARVGERRLVVLSTGIMMRVFELRRPDVSLLWLSAVVGAVVALLTGVATWIKRRSGRVGRAAAGVAEPGCASDLDAELLDAMIAFGHAGGSLRIIDRLRFHLQNWKRWVEADSPLLAAFTELCDAYSQAVVADLLNVASLSRRAGLARNTWASLEQNAQRAVEVLSGLRAGSHAEEDVTHAASHLVEVDRRLQEIRAHLRRTFATPLQPVLDQVLARRRQEIGSAHAEVKVSGLGERDPTVFVSSVALEKILDGLVDNALSAMAESAKRNLDIDVGTEGDHYTIDVRDTGRGIAESNKERVFDRDYTTKEGGGGFGLYYARQQLARFGGKIYVLRSAAGEGTTIRVVLRSA